MREEYEHDILYPTKEEILAIHRDIISEDEDAEPGVKNDGHVEFALEYIEHGHFGKAPKSIHEKAVSLMRLLSANHPFVDGNKRTALNSTWTFYAMNGLYFDYGEEIKAILKLFAVMERMVDQEEATKYFEEIALPEDHEQVPTWIVRLIHIPRWHQDFTERVISFSTKASEASDPDEEYAKKFVDLFNEFENLSVELSHIKENHQEKLSEEIIDEIDKFKAEYERVESLVNELVRRYESDEDISAWLENKAKEWGLDEEVKEEKPSKGTVEDDSDSNTKS